MMPTLNVYIRDNCWSCAEAQNIVTDMREQFPDIDIALVDVSPEEWPNEVFAVPTYMLDGKVISLGNPTREGLQDRLESVRNP